MARRRKRLVEGTDTLYQRLDHDATASLVRFAEICDEAQRLIKDREYERAIELLFPLWLAELPSLHSRILYLATHALNELADACHDSGDFEAELRYLQEWLHMDPQALYPLVRSGEILWLELDRDEEAYEIFQRAVEAHPFCLEAWLGMAKISFYQGNYGRAIELLHNAWNSLPHAEWAYPPTRVIISNILESLYEATAQVFKALGEVRLARNILQEGIRVLGHSDYLSEALRALEKNYESGQDYQSQ